MPTSCRVAALLAAFLLFPSLARAADTVTIQGTTDVVDSHLVPDVLKPGFEAAYPQYTLNYVAPPGGTGAAFANARAGAGDGAIVHAPAIENQFVADGFSLEPYGRAIFWGDFVILGTSSDPAGVLANDQHNAAAAFARIAQDGVAGNSQFVSRGGASGTSVAEHQIWALAAPLTTGVTFCDVSLANGGGKAPSNVTGACPGTANNPGWYTTTGLGQGPNVTNADTCNYGGRACYTVTDRGTFQYQQSANLIAHLKVVGRDNDASAPGGANLLINSFHAYAINPNAPFTGGAHPTLNTAGAKAFLDYLTSPAAQAAVGRYLNGGGDPPFLPSAAPVLTGTAVPATLEAGKSMTITGNVRNVVPGTPVLSGETVNLSTPRGTVASGATDASGNYSITFAPSANASYSVGTGQIAKVENATLNPVFGDLLAPGSTSVGSTTVQSTIKVTGVTKSYRLATVTGTVAPGTHANGVVTISARTSSKGAFVNKAKVKITGGTYSIPVKLTPGAWQLQARFDDAGQVVSSVASTVKVKVPGASSATISRVSVDGRKLHVTGSVSPAPATSGAYVRLLARRGGKGKFRALGAKVRIARSKRAFTIDRRVSRGGSWQLRVEYAHKGEIDSSTSPTKTVGVG